MQSGQRAGTKSGAWRSVCALCLYGLLLCCMAGLTVCAVQAAPQGCSLTALRPAQRLTFPLEGNGWWQSSPYGWREDPFTGAEAFHQGLDLACAEGTPVLAALDGVVVEARRSASYGNYLRICHEDGLETGYAHLQYLYVRPGEVVRAGQVVGTAGQTGKATGPHLHFELLCQAVRYDPAAALGLTEAGR